MKPIPKCVTDVLTRPCWLGAEHSVFEEGFHPSRRGTYLTYLDRNGPPVSGFTGRELARMAIEGVFGPLYRVETQYDHVVINEHAVHALTDFRSEVYAAWTRYQKRLAQAERMGPDVADPKARVVKAKTTAQPEISP